MTKNLILVAAVWLGCLSAAADPGDTTIVQTFTWEEQLAQSGAYKSPGRRWFQFPEDDGTSYQKILMYHTLKCFDGGLTAGGLGFPCGEWDYLTYNFLFEHTGVLDSTFSTHPFYLLNNQGFETASVSTDAAFNVLRNSYTAVTDPQATNESTTDFSAMESSDLNALRTDRRRSRLQFTYSADELMAMGLSAGSIGRLELVMGDVVGEGGLLTLRMAATNTDATDTWFAGPMTEVYTDVFNPAAGENLLLNFHTPFAYDGSSNLVFELNYTASAGGLPTALVGHTAASVVVDSETDDRYIRFNGNAFVEVPAAAVNTLTDEVTVMFWVRGDAAVQPANQYCFEGTNSNGQRVLNSHLPWGNGRVYWDAGQSGGYDRIDKAAANSEFEGLWNHYAFTKNASTGVMNIFLNGELWHTGSELTRLMDDIVRFRIGSSSGGGSFYNGDIDEFAIFAEALDQATIAEFMTRRIDESHPAYSNLRVYYTFNNNNAQLITDHSGNDFHGYVVGQADRRLHPASGLFLREAASSFRPAIALHSGDYTPVTVEASYDEPVVAPASSLVTYQINGNFVEVINVEAVWPETDEYGVFDPEGNFIEPYSNNLGYIDVVNSTLEYYGVPFEVVNRYEIGRYITPYGIGLTLDDDGWTWVFDVTDYAPLLQGMVELEAGNWQELLDLKFLFIEGTPPREVKRVDAFWKGSYNLNTFDENVTEHSFTPEEGEETFRLKTRASGHGFGQGNNCAEFCFNTHTVEVNGTPQWSWEIMQECADNPLHPQGGTWIYDRAGWCPGDVVTTQDFELTPLVSNDAPFTVDYDITFDPNGNYVMEGQIIAYGPHNFTNDVELMEILAPSTMKIRSRINPICNKPVVRIRNNGSAPLTSCTINFGLEGAMESFEWTGNLAFAEFEDVTLTYSNTDLWFSEESETGLFMVEVGAPNGATDENAFNNTGTSVFNRPPVYSYPDLDDNRVIVWVNTNAVPWQNTSSIETMNGSVIWSRTYDAPQTTFRDTLNINQGCYTYRLTDSAENGLAFFANNEGNGTARLRRVGGSLIQFDPDFGKDIVHTFYMKTNLVSVEEEEQAQGPSLTVFPNPGNDQFILRVANASSAMIWQVYNLSGQLVREGQGRGVVQGVYNDILIPTADLPAGIYQVVVTDRGIRSATRWVK